LKFLIIIFVITAPNIKNIMIKTLLTIFPVLIFQVTFGQNIVTINPVKDNTLFENAGGTLSNGAGDHVFAGTTTSGLKRRGLLKFDITGNIPAGSTITSVELTLTFDQPHSTTNMVTIHAVTTDWGEGTSVSGGGSGAASTAGDATWIHTFYPVATWPAPGGDFNSSPSANTAVSSVGIYSWSSAQMITDLQSWLDDPSTNFGWEVIGDESTTQTAKRFASREHATTANRPSLTIIYTAPPCNNASVSSFTSSSPVICDGDSATITVNGNLNDATTWHLYSGNCGGTSIESNTSGIFNVGPSLDTDYFVRAEGGCVTSTSCNTLSITVTPPQNSSFLYSSLSYCTDDPDPTPVPAVTGGNFNSSAGLIINSSTGEIDLSSSIAGVYTVTYITPGPCSSVGMQTVALNNPMNSTVTETICNGESFILGTQTLTSPGTYTEIFMHPSGCDSTVTLTLNITTVDISVTDNSPTLTANSATGTYQWIDCDNGNSFISGATSQDYTLMAPGNVGVIITVNGCIDTSACMVVVPESIGQLLNASFEISPNPSQETINIMFMIPQSHALIEIMNVAGQTLITESTKGEQKKEINIRELPKGAYLIRIVTEKETKTARIIKS
jgi:hypothetical protein